MFFSFSFSFVLSISEFIMSLEIAKRLAPVIECGTLCEVKELLSPYSFEQRKFILSTDVSGSSFLYHAVLHQSYSMAKYFLEECGVDPNSFGIGLSGKETCLSKAVSLDSQVIVEILLRHGADINGVSFGYKTAIATACTESNLSNDQIFSRKRCQYQYPT